MVGRQGFPEGRRLRRLTPCGVCRRRRPTCSDDRADGEKIHRSHSRRGTRDRRAPTGLIHAAVNGDDDLRAVSTWTSCTSSFAVGSPSSTFRTTAAARPATMRPVGPSNDPKPAGDSRLQRASSGGLAVSDVGHE
jgi:hypothetical protein